LKAGFAVFTENAYYVTVTKCNHPQIFMVYSKTSLIYSNFGRGGEYTWIKTKYFSVKKKKKEREKKKKTEGGREAGEEEEEGEKEEEEEGEKEEK